MKIRHRISFANDNHVVYFSLALLCAFFLSWSVQASTDCIEVATDGSTTTNATTTCNVAENDEDASGVMSDETEGIPQVNDEKVIVTETSTSTNDVLIEELTANQPPLELDAQVSLSLAPAALSLENATPTEIVVIQPGPEEGKDTRYGTVYAKDGDPDGTVLSIGGWGDIYYSLIEFPLDRLPVDSTNIVKAELYLYNTTNNGRNYGRYEQVTEPWEENEPSIDNRITSAATGHAWQQVPNQDWWVVDVTNITRDWVDGTYPNYGIKLFGLYYQNNVFKNFVSSDNTVSPELRPKLVVEIVEGTAPEPEPICCSNILFLPGVMASRLYRDRVIGGADRVWEPDVLGDDVSDLAMDELGNSVNNIYTSDVIDRASYPGKEIVAYDTFLDFLDDLEFTGDIASWQAFAYDWRYDVRDVVEYGTVTNVDGDRVYPIDALLAEAESAPNGKVTIIAHSNGGLLAKAMFLKMQERCDNGETEVCPENVVDQVIFLGSPQLGTPQAIFRLLHGQEMNFKERFVYTQAEFREVTKNLPVAYDLLPSEDYFGVLNGKALVSFDGSGDLFADFTTAYPDGITDYQALVDFLNGAEGRPGANKYNVEFPSKANPTLLASSQNTLEVLAGWQAPPGVGVVEIVGTGIPTMAGLKYTAVDHYVCFLPGIPPCTNHPELIATPVMSLYGDETVMALSAEGYESQKQTYYFDFSKYNEEADANKTDLAFVSSHQNFSEPSYIQSFLEQIITGTTTASLPNYLYDELPSYEGETYDGISSHSPVHLSITDNDGNFTGRVFEEDGTTYIFEDVPGSRYFEIGSSTYLYVPSDTEYTVTVEAYDAGSFTLMVEEITDGEESTTISELTQLITEETSATFSKHSGAFSSLAIDQNGDGIPDEKKTLTGEGIEIEFTYEDLYHSVKALTLSKKEERGILSLVKIAEKLSEGGRFQQKLAKVALSILDGKLYWHIQRGQISEAQYLVIHTIINQLQAQQ